MRIPPILIFFIFCFTACKAQPETKNEQPNIVFILADDLGWADLPLYGNRFNEAPNLEKLARQGVKFNNAYAANPVCSPTRASIQTGLYPARMGINDWIPGHWRPYENVLAAINTVQHLPHDTETLGELLKKAGYTTGFFGKWHLGNDEKSKPKNRGYDESVIFDSAPFFGYQTSMQPKQDFPKDMVLSEALTNLSTNFISQNKDKPFFLFLSHFDVHVQLDAQDQLIQKYLSKPKVKNYPCNAIYAAMIENIDNSVGAVMDKLEALNLADNTLVVFFSDNGGLIKRFDEIPLIHQRSAHIYANDTLQYIATSNAPLKGEKGNLYEGGIKEPMLVKWPNHIKAGATSNAMVSSIDFFPTFAEVAGLSKKAQPKVDGKSILQILSENEKTAEHRPLFWHYPVYHHSVPASAVRVGDYKLIEFLDDKHIELYNLKTDIGETTDLSVKHPKKAKELLGLLQKWQKNTNAAMPTKNPNFNPERRYEWGKHPDATKEVIR
ncbi:sulfatase [Tamlana sp. I1]|uniref:sulfatase n=1 Tax=Tamlana sp. I1 TaxID=2762061 RepID=UPI00188EAF15|nr:sulfatase [Tamlana sp. I1]